MMTNKTTKVRCRNVMGGIYVAEGEVLAIDDKLVLVRHKVSEVQFAKVDREYDRKTGSWRPRRPGGTLYAQADRSAYITKGDLAKLAPR